MKIMSPNYGFGSVRMTSRVSTMHSEAARRHRRRPLNRKGKHMWTKPEYTEMRFGFEVTMYIASR
jgi:coenzyme PQQ precursor peptide PqqA